MPGLKTLLPLLFILFFLSACERGERPLEAPRPPVVDDTAGVAERLDALTERPNAVVDTIPADRTDLDVARRMYERAPGDPEAAIVHPDGAATPGPDWPSLLGRTPQEVRAEHGEHPW